MTVEQNRDDHQYETPSQGAWRPIETAPTNMAILINVPRLTYYGNGGCYAGMLVDMGTGRRWMTFGWAIGRDLDRDDAPTHWMPLPAPPHSAPMTDDPITGTAST